MRKFYWRLETQPKVGLINFNTSHFPNVPFKCVRLEVNFEEYSDLPLPTGTWTTFTNCEKLEIYFSWNNEEAHKIKYHNVLKLFKHLSLHVILWRPIHVSDAKPSGDWHGNQYWKLYDVEYFAMRIAVSPIRTLTYPLSEPLLRSTPTVTFNCDENFTVSFMEFLETQPIYCGYEEFYEFLTLESAKESFPT